MTGGQMAEVVISREVAANSVLSAYRIELDGTRVGKIGSGKRLVLPVPAGPHALTVGIEFTSSKPYEFDIAPGGRLELTCGPKFSFVESLVKAFTSRRDFLKIQLASRS